LPILEEERMLMRWDYSSIMIGPLRLKQMKAACERCLMEALKRYSWKRAEMNMTNRMQ
jgi:hypothetical protein